MTALLGILGGGQLGRMMALSAAKLGVSCSIFAPEDVPCAAQVAPHVQASYEDQEALSQWAQTCQVITFEFENIATDCLSVCADKLFPSANSLKYAQHRGLEKEFLSSCHVPLARWMMINSMDDLREAGNKLGFPFVTKTCRFGYDGKGQYVVHGPEDIDAAFSVVGADAVAEEFVSFVREISVVAVFDREGHFKTYDACENIHRNQMLDQTILPAQISAATEELAKKHAVTIGKALGHVGVLTTEFFVLKDGSLAVNEIAPRVHNSGHWTMEGAATSQFENHVRAVMGWPLGDVTRLGDIDMRNIIGPDMDHLRQNPPTKWSFHDYGKSPSLPGRKMGHLTKVSAAQPSS